MPGEYGSDQCRSMMGSWGRPADCSLIESTRERGKSICDQLEIDKSGFKSSSIKMAYRINEIIAYGIAWD